ncbi:S-methyl-5-thioribose kinase [Deinococcus yavapaiensis]|uniref:S-methyl-5-thioribose kinase n=1 Tax=Deinococcus yavapaiensis KR-236 TaxID=694435 RepID=A0A318SIY4_9DEIO|nr:S-methyl-5-thioribose kinase [Deinococcus yavapaiensis]PYE51883.1 5'-methylthioribose kinase [Deinococcus yavapaiensis KR-236]
MTDAVSFGAYRPLSLDSVVAYLRSRSESADLLDLTADLSVREVGDGNLNLVFQVAERDRPSRSLLVKQALPYVRVAGEGWPLSTRRAHYEARSLRRFFESAPDFVPRPFWHDDVMALSVMENLREHRVVRGLLNERRVLPGLGEAMGRFLAATLFDTSDFALPSDEKRRLVGDFDNPELCRITEDLVFTEPFSEAAERNRFNDLVANDVRDLQGDESLRAHAARLKLTFLTSAQALLHGDLHTGSVMSLGDDHRVIDSEFAFVGPMGFDLGLFLANLLLSACAHEVRTEHRAARAEFRSYLLQEGRSMWSTFEADFRERLAKAESPSWNSPAFQDAFLQGVLRDTVGFAGCEMIRRTVGFAHVSDLDGIENPEARAVAERLALTLGRTLMLEAQGVSTFDDALRLMRW